MKHPLPLPGDEYLAELLGWTPEQLLQYQTERWQAAAQAPAPLVVCEPISGTLAVISLVTTILSVGYTLLSLLLAPKQRRPGEIRSTQRQGDTISDSGRYSPRPGFDSTQEVARLGTVIPVTFARREFLPALNGRPEGFYGGIRINAGLVWSQMFSLGGSQLFRGVYVLGEAPIASVDPQGFALGNNPLRSYDLGTDGANEAAARLTIYSRPGGGRILGTDRVAGRLASADLGNVENAGGADVFQLGSLGNAILPDACATGRPSTSTSFGLYATVANGLGYRVNPQLRPTRVMTAKPSGNDGNQRLDPTDDVVALGALWKARSMWSGRSGITTTSRDWVSNSATLEIGDSFLYLLSNTTDAKTQFQFDGSQTDSDQKHRETFSDVAVAISSRQRSADDALLIGDIYKAGSCLAVLETRTPATDVFVSDADNEPVGGGQQMVCLFRVIRGGIVNETTDNEINPSTSGGRTEPRVADESDNWDWASIDPGPRYPTGTSRGHLHRCAIADFTLARPAQVIEIGFRSTVGIRGQGFANVRQIPSLREINKKAGGEREGEILESGDKLEISSFQTGTRSFSEERYSFFRVSYRAEAGATFTELPTIYGVRGLTQQPQYNYLRLQMPSAARWQYRIEPLSGWEIRSGAQAGSMAVLDARRNVIESVQSFTDGAVVATYTGEAPFTRSVERFSLDSIEPNERSSLVGLTTQTNNDRGRPGTYTNAVILQDGEATNSRATVVVPTDGNFDHLAITMTEAGNDYNGDDALTLINGDSGSSRVLSTRSFQLAPTSIAFLGELSVPENTVVPRRGSRVSFSGTLPAELETGRTYWVAALVSGEAGLNGYPFSAAALVAGLAGLNVYPFSVALTGSRFIVSETDGGSWVPVSVGGSSSGMTCTQWVDAFTLIVASAGPFTVVGGPAVPAVDTPIEFDSTGTLPSPLVADTEYFVHSVTATTFFVSATVGGSSISLSTPGTGVITGRISNATNWVGAPLLGKTDIGIGWSDEDALTDKWAKVAEVFVYDEIQTSASVGPEHEIAYVNVIQTNAVAPSYRNLAGLGLSIRSSLEFSSVGQFSAQLLGGHSAERYLEETAGPSHLLPDAFRTLALSPDFGGGLEVAPDQINEPSSVVAAQWCFDRRYFFDGTLGTPENLRGWAAEQAPLHLLAFYELNGQFYWKPAITWDPVPIVDLFTAANIKPGSFKSTTSDDDQRRPIQVSGAYRDERANDDIQAPGMFATAREITIREASGSDSDPIEPLDITDSCTNRWHLLDAMKFLIRWRRLVGDPISFETNYSGLLRPISPEDHIAVAYDEVLDELYSNGAVLADGTLIATEPLADGSYEVLAWDGITLPGPTIQTLTVTDQGKTGSPVGINWTRTAPPQVRTYRVMRVSPTDDGRLRIEALLMPTDDEGRLLISLDWDDEDAWVIRG